MAKHADTPRRLLPSEVRYLAFEGGGAKGLAFIGALAALDALNIRLQSQRGGLVRGVSGASAGSMTCFLHAMGFTPRELIEIQMADGAFLRFFQAPEVNVVRAVVGRHPVPRHEMVRFMGREARYLPVAAEAVKARMLGIQQFPLNITPSALKGASRVLFGRDTVPDLVQGEIMNLLLRVGRQNEQLEPMLKRIASRYETFQSYAYCLLYDLGLFSGIEVRNFLREQLEVYLQKQGKSQIFVADRVTIGEFARLTNISIAFSAVNATTGRGHYFRDAPSTKLSTATPEFPVLDAVAISSAYPLAFKPYVVVDRTDVPNGYWLDGGVQNNYPLHAFDRAPDAPIERGILGLRLEAAPNASKFLADVGAYTDPSLFGFFGSFIGSIASAALYPTEGGQVRTAQEQAQTVDIVVPEDLLSTLDFAPKRNRVGDAILIAFDSVALYFHPDYTPRKSSASPVVPEIEALRTARAGLAGLL